MQNMKCKMQIKYKPISRKNGLKIHFKKNEGMLYFVIECRKANGYSMLRYTQFSVQYTRTHQHISVSMNVSVKQKLTKFNMN